MTLVDLTQPLADSDMLQKLAKRSGITLDQAKLFMAELGDAPIRQVVRIGKTCHADRLRKINRATRKGEPWGE